MFTAFAPLYNPIILTIGGVISGYCEMGIPDKMSNPKMTVRIEITIATMGLRIKNSLMMVVLRDENYLTKVES
jgi:hypothetical protein